RKLSGTRRTPKNRLSGMPPSITPGGALGSPRCESPQKNAFRSQRTPKGHKGGAQRKSLSKQRSRASWRCFSRMQRNPVHGKGSDTLCAPGGVSHDVEGVLSWSSSSRKNFKGLTADSGNPPFGMDCTGLARESSRGHSPTRRTRALTDELEDLEFQFDDLRETRRKLGIWVTALPPVAPEGVNKKIEKFTDQVNRVFGLYLQTIADLDVSKGSSTQPLKDAFAAYGGKDGDMLPHKYVRLMTALQKDIYESNPELKPRVGGALYTHWGRGECPKDEEASVVGVMSASETSRMGGSSDFVCVQPDPIHPNPKIISKGRTIQMITYSSALSGTWARRVDSATCP
ncbi:hypothetical protein JTE90_018649, partial [Oedothorax gibbosus]